MLCVVHCLRLSFGDCWTYLCFLSLDFKVLFWGGHLASWISKCLLLCICVFEHTCECTCMLVCVHAHVCMHTCVCMCMRMCTHVHTHEHAWPDVRCFHLCYFCKNIRLERAPGHCSLYLTAKTYGFVLCFIKESGYDLENIT